LLSCVAVSQSPPSITPQIVVVTSGNQRLKGCLWRPAGATPSPAVLFVHGSGSIDALHTSGFAITKAADRLAPTFRMLAAVRKTTAPIMLLHAENDYSTAPGKAMADDLARLGKPHVLKIYPPVGRTADDGHNFVYTAVAEWEADVFGFLDQYVRR